MSYSKLPNDRSLPSDTLSMAQAITALNDREVAFVRATRYQLKIGEWNFYPDRGTIVRDDADGAESARGLDALLTLLGHSTGDPFRNSIHNHRTPRNALKSPDD